LRTHVIATVNATVWTLYDHPSPMLLVSRISLFLCLLIFPISAEPELILTESNIADRIHIQNPDLKAARWKIQEALGQYQQSGRPARPSLDVQWSHDSRLREGEVKIGVTRSFPVTDRLQWEKAISKAQLEAAEMEIRRVEQQLVTDARLILIQVIALKNRRQWMTLEEKEAREFAAQLQKNQQRAEGSALEATQAKIDAASLLIEQKQLDAREVALQAELRNLLGMPIGASIHTSNELPALMPAAGGSLTQRADYQQTLKQIDTAKNRVQRELSNRYDNLDAGIFLSGMRQQDLPSGYNNDVMLGFQLSIPLPFGDDNSGNIATAKAQVERFHEEAKSILAKAKHESQGASAEMLEWKKLDAQITDELLPLAEEQLKLAIQAYTQGQGDLSSIFRARTQKRQLLLSRVDARSSYHLARIRLQAAHGQP
jgi:outer membrane protein TolC